MPQPGPSPRSEQGLEAEAAGGLGAVQRSRAGLLRLHNHFDESVLTEFRFPL